ncbi:TolC family protein [Pseudochryseolinea flava]|nr:TolC family protein [Pseudochryseolinea flava]
MKKVSVLILSFFTLPFLASAQVDSLATEWTLKQCIDYALANSLTVKRSTYAVETSEVDYDEAKYSRLPSVNGQVSYGSSWGRGLDPVSNDFVTQQINSSNIGAQASLPLFNGMRIHSAIKQLRTANAAAEQDLAKTKNDITINVATLFINVVFNKELVENAKYQLASSQQQLDRTKKQVAAGSLAKSEELNLDAQVATNEVNLVQQENALALSLLQLKQALQIPASQPFDVEIPAIEPQDVMLTQSRDEVFDIAKQVMPEIKAAEYKVQSSEFAVKAARGNLYPRLSLIGNINTNYSSAASPRRIVDEGRFLYDDSNGDGVADLDAAIGMSNGQPVYTYVQNSHMENYNARRQFEDNIYRTVTLQLSIPIFNSYQARASVRRSVIQREVAKVSAAETAQTLRQDVETAYNNAVASSKSYNANTRQVQAREEAFRMMKQRYEIGAINFVEYQVSENDLYRAKSDLLRAKYDFIFRTKVLDLYQGKSIY